MSTIKDKLIESKNLKHDLVYNLNSIDLVAEEDETYNTLIPKIYNKVGGFAKLSLPWFNLAYYEGTEAGLIFDSITFTEPPTNFNNWCYNLKDPTLVFKPADYIDFTKSPSINSMGANMVCKEVIIDGVDFTYLAKTSPYFLKNLTAEKLTISNCIFNPIYPYYMNSYTDGTSTVEEIEIRDITITGGSRITTFWGGKGPKTLKRFSLKNIQADTTFEYEPAACDMLEYIHIDNVTCNEIYSYESFVYILSRGLLIKDVIIENCELNKISSVVTGAGSYSLETANKAIERFVLRNIVIDESAWVGREYSGLRHYVIGGCNYADRGYNYRTKLKEVDLSNWSGIINELQYIGGFAADAKLTDEGFDYIDFKMDNLDVSQVTNIRYFCRNLGPVKNLDTLKTFNGVAPIEIAEGAFAFLSEPFNREFMNSEKAHCLVEEIDLTHFDFSNCTNFEQFMCQYNGSFKGSINNTVKRIIGTFDLSNVPRTTPYNTNYYNRPAFAGLAALEEIPPLINLGKAINTSQTNATLHAYACCLNFTYSVNLTYNSIINLINGLYDLNLTYNVANGGTLVSQKLILGAANLAKLTPEEIAIATNKGWTVS